jgi:hypothetical protein
MVSDQMLIDEWYYILQLGKSTAVIS